MIDLEETVAPYHKAENGFDIVSRNLALLDRFVGGDEARWLMITTDNAEIPHTRQWVAISPLLIVENIGMGRRAAKLGIDTDGFVGNVDYVLVNYIKHRQMIVCACFDSEDDAMLWKMRQP